MDTNAKRIDLIQTILRLPVARLQAAADCLGRLEAPLPTTLPLPTNAPEDSIKDWPHAPRHRLSESGTYMVTTGTYQKAHVFGTAERLCFLEGSLLAKAREYGWHLEAWAVFSNHYHFVGYTLSSPSKLREFLTELHASTARAANREDGQEGRQVWHNFWDKQLTYEKSYLARLNYVHQNAVKHGLVSFANQYRWCSAAWLERTALPAQLKTIFSFKIDRLKVADDFEPLLVL